MKIVIMREAFKYLPMLLLVTVLSLGAAHQAQAASDTPYTKTIVPAACGSLTPASPLSKNSTTTMTFTANSNYRFDTVSRTQSGTPAVLGTPSTTGQITNFTINPNNNTNNIAFTINCKIALTPTAGTGGSITPASPVYVPNNGSQTFTITPADACYQTSSVKVDGGAELGALASYPFSNVTAPHSLAALFTKKSFTITATAGAGGSISPTATFNCGDSVTYTITPDSTHLVDTVTVDGNSEGTRTSYTFSPITANHTINATFKAKPQWNITASVATVGGGTGGSISPSGTVTVDDGTNQTFTITTNPGYEIQSIMVDGSPVASAPSVTLYSTHGARTIAVTFVHQWTVTSSVDPTKTGGTITPLGAQTVSHGATPSFTVTADASHYVDTVTVGAGVSTAAAKTVTYPFTIPGVTANTDVVAAFKLRPVYPVNVLCWDWITSAIVCRGTVTPSGWQNIREGNDLTITATSDPGYALDQYWVKAIASDPWTLYPASPTFTLSDVQKRYDYVYVTWKERQFIITATAGANGTISPAGAIGVNSSTATTLTITPNAGYDIDAVTVDGVAVGAVGTYTFSAPVTKDHTISVTFKPHMYSLSATWGDGAAPDNHVGGTVSPVSSSVAYTGSQAFTITPADATYYISSIKDNGAEQGGAASGPVTYTINPVAMNHAIVVTFTRKNVYKITISNGGNGTINPPGAVQSGDTLPSITVIQGDSAVFAFTGNAGYNVQDVRVDGVSQGPVATLTIPNVQAAHSVSATFVTAYTITAMAGTGIGTAHGTITPAGAVKVNSGDSKTFIFTPDTGYGVFDVVIDAGTGSEYHTTNSSYTFPAVSANHTITATFVSGGSQMNDYCNLPSFISGDIRPNLLLLLDNSASMYDLAYITPATFCTDISYDNTAPYAGYFDQGGFYSYDSANGKFTGGAALPASCTFRTGYVCVNMTGTAPNRTVSQFVGSGKFLNWLSASKLDIEKQALTGGKFDSTYNVLIGESRGCIGKRFLKALPALPNITFAVRGPGSFEADFTNLTTRGGQTRIEIYDASYINGNMTACQNAVTDWSTGANMGTTQGDTKDCIGTGPNALSTSVYNHMIHDCYWVKSGHGLSNLGNTESDCADIYGSDPLAPSRITSDSSGNSLCSSVLPHAFMTNNGSVGNSTGYLGKCATYSGGHWNWDDTCATTETYDFCSGIDTSSVTDPSSSAYVSGTSQNVPGFIVDMGVNALGNIAATMLVKVGLSAAPTGVISGFQNVINFGAMVFNFDGSASELNSIHSGTNISQPKVCHNSDPQIHCFSSADCPGTSCDSYTPLDGSKVISYVNVDPVGDHDIGLISKIDAIQATSWTPHAEAFYNAIGYFAQRSDTRLNSSDFMIDAAHNPSRFTCQKNNVLIITDGMSTADRNSSVMTLANLYKSPSNQTTSAATAWTAAPLYAGSTNLDDLAWLAKNKNIFNFANAPVNTNDTIKTYAVYTGAPCSAKAADGITCTSTAETDPEVQIQHAALYGGGQYWKADTSDLQDKIRRAFEDIAVQASSGTAASILSNSAGSGAIILQAVFYPSKTFDSGATSVSWIGELQNLWYYVSPFIAGSTVREDTGYTATNRANNVDHVFDLKNDYVTDFVFDGKDTSVNLSQDTNVDGFGDLGKGNVTADQVNSLWRAGRQLWMRTAPRSILTHLDAGLIDITSIDTSSADNRGLFQASDKAEADRIISYIGGTDNPAYRSRSIVIPPAPPTGNVGTDNVSRVWKLGDIVTSTPRVQSSVPMGIYDLLPPAGYNDTSYVKFIAKDAYQNQGMAYVGANDGMLHAFKLGQLIVTPKSDADRATLVGNNKAILRGTGLGEEQWAFVPKNVLPYLKYLADKNYSHLYYVDGPSVIADVSTGTTPGCAGDYWDCSRDLVDGTNWKTVLVGGMGLGGASRDKSGSCTDGTSNCVKSPIDGSGYSAYYALDITNQSFDPATGALQGGPTLLWEFSDPALGYATSGPAIVRIKASTDGPSKNGRWYAVLASGPTGPIDSTVCTFKGGTDQTLKLFILDLQSGTLLRTIDMKDHGMTENAFAGSITNGVTDTDRWKAAAAGHYQDDVIYIPYVKQRNDGTWTDGGVLRLSTKENIDPAQWVVSKVIDGIGPVTANVAKLQDRKYHNFWLYFGTGRYFYGNDDKTTRRQLIAVKDPCYTSADNYNPNCTTTLQFSDLTNQDDGAYDALGGLLGGDKGWYITLDAEDTTNHYGAERLVTDPVALTNGSVIFTTFEPTTDACKFGGRSYLWATKYDTGYQAPAAALEGKALVQVSTGSFEQVDLRSVFTANGHRKMNRPMQGKPPSDPPPIVTKSNLKPVKKIVHIQEH